MKLSLPASPRTNARLNLLVLAVFVLLTYIKYSGAIGLGDDLSSSYVGCVVMSEGEALDHLYAHHPTDFASIGEDDVWLDAAQQGGFPGFLHPYVQTPLWAFLCQPICTRTTFASFKKIFTLLELLCFAATIWSIARYWTPSLYNPIALAAICFLLAKSQPFQYAMYLLQSHIIFFCITIAGLILAEKRRPGLAGLLVAFAAAVKVTPVLLLLYWLVAKRWKAAAYMAGWLVLLSALTVFTTGLPLFRLYLAEVSRVGHVLLLSRNNQSFAAWWMSPFYPAGEVFRYTIHPLPRGLRLALAAAMMAFTAFGGWLDRSRSALDQPAPSFEGRLFGALPFGALPFGALPFGAMIALLSATIFAPIAWTHYFIVLVAPLMLLVQANLRRWSWPLTALIVAIVALNFRPLAAPVTEETIGSFALIRGQLLAGCMCLVALGWLALRTTRRGTREGKAAAATPVARPVLPMSP